MTSSFPTAACLIGLASSAALAIGASEACAKPRDVDLLVRQDAALSALDRQLGGAVANARRRPWPRRRQLALDQRRWMSSRGQCLSDPDPKGCLANLYAARIAQLSSDAGLPPARPPIRFRCDGDPPLGFTITYYATNPGTLVAERRGQKIVMVQQPMASGIRYTAANASYGEHQGVSWITWPGQPRALRCVR
jgi:uncharacterized protein